MSRLVLKKLNRVPRVRNFSYSDGVKSLATKHRTEKRAIEANP